MVTGSWLRVTGCWLLVAGCWFMVAVREHLTGQALSLHFIFHFSFDSANITNFLVIQLRY